MNSWTRQSHYLMIKTLSYCKETTQAVYNYGRQLQLSILSKVQFMLSHTLHHMYAICTWQFHCWTAPLSIEIGIKVEIKCTPGSQTGIWRWMGRGYSSYINPKMGIFLLVNLMLLSPTTSCPQPFHSYTEEHAEIIVSLPQPTPKH